MERAVGQVTLSNDHCKPRNDKPQREIKPIPSKQVFEEQLKNQAKAVKAL